ncbi:MAG: aminoacyl-tRNA hydrolase [Actinomycetia bacterium]|nr:aminoacyl-tRNA hydrolase [Actinomycetes bacterium]
MTRFNIPETELRWRFDAPGGPGGQHANKTASRAELRFDVAASDAFDASTRDRIIARLGVEVRVIEQGSRSQVANRKQAILRLHAMIEEAAQPGPPQRRATRPSRSARARRISNKRAQSRKKQYRRRPSGDD